MNIFAGNITLEEAKKLPELDFDIIPSGEKTYFIMGADETLQNSNEVISYLEKHLGKLAFYDISIESEDMLEVISSEYELGTYECVSFEGVNVEFSDILERFTESTEVICVREAEASDKYGNKIVKVDFVY